MHSDNIKLDDDGIPVLEDRVPADTTPAAETEAAAGPDLTDEEQIGQLLQSESVHMLLEDLTEDLQKMVSWKIESFLKEELGRLVQDATRESASRLSDEIRTQLQLALPELLAKINKQAKS
jgi:hypothetical protein